MLKRSLILAAALAVTAGAAQAEYPDKGLSFIVPFPPGGASNFIGRAIATEMATDLDQDITVLNKAGAAGTVGGAEIARAAPDGYTIGILTSTPLLMKPHTAELPYDLSSFDVVCRAFDNPLILTVSAKSEITSFEDLMAKAKERPGAVKYYTEGPGSLQDIAMSDLEQQAGYKAIGVPMKGHQAAVQNLLSGVIDVAPLTAEAVLGNPDLLRPIAIMSAERVEAPDVPTISELGYNDVIYSLTGAIVAPKGLEPAVYDRLVASCSAAQKSAGFTETLTKFSMPKVSETGEASAKSIGKQYEAIGAYIEKNGLGAK